MFRPGPVHCFVHVYVHTYVRVCHASIGVSWIQHNRHQTLLGETSHFHDIYTTSHVVGRKGDQRQIRRSFEYVHWRILWWRCQFPCFLLRSMSVIRSRRSNKNPGVIVVALKTESPSHLPTLVEWNAEAKRWKLCQICDSILKM